MDRLLTNQQGQLVGIRTAMVEVPSGEVAIHALLLSSSGFFLGPRRLC
jgi:hypothetical protein